MNARARRLVVLGAGPLLALLLAPACPPEDEADATDAAGDAADAGGELQWYWTCGDPVCQGYTGPSGVPGCTTETPGDPCSPAGAQCDPVDSCNRLLRCTDVDPTTLPGGCPISRRAAKRDVRPLDEADVARLHEALLAMPLSTWRYLTDAPDRAPRLGFVLEDVGASPAVDADRGMVDLYGLAALAAAGLQAQQRELDGLRAEVAALREALAAGACPAPPAR